MPGLHACAAEVCHAFDLRIGAGGNPIVRKTCHRGWPDQCIDIEGKWNSTTGNYDIEKVGQVYKLVRERNNQGEAIRWNLLLPCPDGNYRAWGGVQPEPWELEFRPGQCFGKASLMIKGNCAGKTLWEDEAWPMSAVGVVNVVAVRKLEIELRSMENARFWFNKKDTDKNGSLSKCEIEVSLKGCGLSYHEEWDENHDGMISEEEFFKAGGMREKILEYLRSHLNDDK